jgi:membrane protein implicated in regulation of membrane protease activity
MTAPPMRPWQNAVALAAILLAAGALLPLAPRIRIALAALAIAVILLLLGARLRAHAKRRDSARVDGTYQRIARIREQRASRRR